MADKKKFRFSIDRGGTFTDIYAEVPGEPGFRVLKLLSEDPGNYDDAPREGIRRIIESVSGNKISSNFDVGCIEWIRMGTTLATNALLERKGAPSALAVTRGFGDILQIGHQARPKLFDLKITKPDLLYTAVIEADERIRILRSNEKHPQGRVVTGLTGQKFLVLKPIDLDRLRPRLQAVLDQGIKSLAVAFMHAYAWPEHEIEVGWLALEMGFEQVSLSSQIMPMSKIVPRGDTASADAYLNPCIRSYIENFKQDFLAELEDDKLFFMQSDGSLARGANFRGSRAVLSGPAGGVVGCAATAFEQSGNIPVIGFDMGGTSTDVSRFGGDYEMDMESECAGVRIQAPQLQIKTVAAGGGSRLFFENGLFLVGPQSAGAHPGPVCYGKNGFLSVTDANLVLGRLRPEYFPKIFGPNEDQPLDCAAARKAMESLTAQANDWLVSRGRSPMTVEETALGFIEVANQVMARPIREISVMRGFDAKDHVLAVFGGAGPQHACSIARTLGMSKIKIHRFSSILSAYGMGLADVAVERQKPCTKTYSPQTLQELLKELQALRAEAEQELVNQGFPKESITSVEYMNMRCRGSDAAFMIASPPDGDFAEAFRQTHAREFGFTIADAEILVDDLRVRSVAASPRLREKNSSPGLPGQAAFGEAPCPLPRPSGNCDCWFSGGWRKTDVYDLKTLNPGSKIYGPALIVDEASTILLEPDCEAFLTAQGQMEIKVVTVAEEKPSAEFDPVRLSIFSNLFMSIAEQMGRMLQKTAKSTNIKERLDFSCALFGPNGGLVANAPHLPVHLGAMSSAVKEQIRIHGSTLKPGDALLSNHPRAGGSHLPDITVMTPVFHNGSIIFWAASRGHHADVGGSAPGSMPPNSRELEEEGAAIASFKLVENNQFKEKEIAALLAAPGKKPGLSGARAIEDNISDLKAQVSANQKGIDLVLEMVRKYGLETVHAYMDYVTQSAEEAVRESLKRLAAAKGSAEESNEIAVEAIDYLDDGSPIALKLTIDGKSGNAIFDFTGTGPELWGNCNAPKAVTRSAVLYSLRCLVEKDLPLNDGCLTPITIRIPAGSLLDPSENAAVVGGNVLTSQRIVDVVLKAFGVAAASQGCMNNFTFGNQCFGYYETIGGGAGAGPAWDGQSGVHTHMTNTRITDPEVLEARYPVLVNEFSIRKGSGGKGAHKGGDGLIREIEFLEPMNMAILSERRVFQPYGLEGGEPGARGQNLFLKKDGRILNLGGKNQIKAEPGDRVRILTPGGGGFGKV